MKHPSESVIKQVPDETETDNHGEHGRHLARDLHQG